MESFTYRQGAGLTLADALREGRSGIHVSGTLSDLGFGSSAGLYGQLDLACPEDQGTID